MIYLDNAASTALDKRVLNVMMPYLAEEFGNPSSVCAPGQKAKTAIDKAKRTIADILGCKAKEIIFTSGGTESVNLAIKGVARAKGKGHIITSNIEHKAALESVKALEKEGFEASYLKADKEGFVSPKDLKKALKKDTILVSIMYANNEIGTIQNIKELSRISQEAGVPLHSDACQAAGALNLKVQELGVDLLTINGSKIYGPKGIGCLYKSEKVNIEALLHGGTQEYGLRAGTENVAYIAGMAKALEIGEKMRKKESARQTKLRDFFMKKVLEEIPDTTLNGSNKNRLPNNVNITFKGLEGETIIMRLDMEEICASSGSACLSGSVDPSHVIMALGVPYEAAHSSVRFTLGRNTSKKDLETTIKKLKKITRELKEFSPLF